MWFFSETGFVSAVQDRKNPEKFVVRGRDRVSLEPLAKFARTKIIDNEGTDYPFRVYVTKKRFAEWVQKQIEALTYTNYKSRMYTTRGPEFVDALHDVWADMHRVTPKGAKRQWWDEVDVLDEEFEQSLIPVGVGKKAGKRGNKPRR